MHLQSPAIRLAYAIAAAVSFATPAAAQQAKEIDPVVVNGMRNPELKRYRVLLAGMDAFEKHRKLAPTAEMVRFKLYARAGAATDPEALSLRISADSFSIPVPVDGDGLFVVPRNAQADDEDADIVLNKKKGAYRWRPDVRSANVPANMRRLGDLRLECQVLVGAAKEEIGLFWTATINSMLLTTDWCNHESISLGTKTDRKVKSAWLITGDNRVKVHVDDNGFVPPLADKAYPDDTLIELEYEDEAAPAFPAA